MSNIQLTDGLRFESEQETLIFNHYSFCELIKHIATKYGNVSYEQAHQKVTESFLVHIPSSQNDVEYWGQELEFHWAMLVVHGDMYWTRGIPSDFIDFKDEYLLWESQTKSTFKLKNAFEYYDV